MKILLTLLITSSLAATSIATAQNLGFGPSQQLNHNADGDDASDVDDFSFTKTDGRGNWVTIWRTYNDLGGILGNDADMFVQRSSDNALTWSAPDVLNINAASDTGDDMIPTLATDGAGRWIATWHSNDDMGGTIGIDYDIFYVISVDNGATWTAPVTLNSGAAGDTAADLEPHIETDGNGTWITSWFFNDPSNIVTGPDSEIMYSISSNNGNTWSAATFLNDNAAIDVKHDSRPRVYVNDLGTWLVAWEWGVVGTEADIHYVRSTDAGVTWTSPLPLNANASTDFGDDFAVRIAGNATGDWVAIWQSTEDLTGSIGSDEDILFATSSDDGLTWSGPSVLNSNADGVTGLDEFPRLATDGAGVYLATWRSTDSLSGAIGTDMDVLGSVSEDEGLTWSTATPLFDFADVDNDVDVPFATETDGNGVWLCAAMSDYDLDGALGSDRDLVMIRTEAITPVALSSFEID